MKQKIVLLIIALMSVAFLSSCQKQDVKTSPESVAVITKPQPAGETSAEGIRPVTIAATSSWSAVSDSDWLTVSPASGEKGMQEVILSFSANTTGASRTGKVTFTAGSYSETFTLVQKGE
jgi:hypothetical protein